MVCDFFWKDVHFDSETCFLKMNTGKQRASVMIDYLAGIVVGNHCSTDSQKNALIAPPCRLQASPSEKI